MLAPVYACIESLSCMFGLVCLSCWNCRRSLPRMYSVSFQTLCFKVFAQTSGFLTSLPTRSVHTLSRHILNISRGNLALPFSFLPGELSWHILRIVSVYLRNHQRGSGSTFFFTTGGNVWWTMTARL